MENRTKEINSQIIAHLIDDDKGVCEAIEYALKKINIETWSTQNSEEFLRFSRKHQPNIFLIDLELKQRLSGYDLIRSIYNIYGNLIPMIVISGSSHSLNIQRALSMGASDFLVKPLNKQLLTKKLSRFIFLTDPTEMAQDYTATPRGVGRAMLNLKMKIQEVDSEGVKFISREKLSTGTLIQINSEFLKPFLTECRQSSLKAKVCSSWLDSDYIHFGIYAEFDPEQKEFLAALRKWIINSSA